MTKLALAFALGVALCATGVRAEDADISAAQGKLQDALATLKAAKGEFAGHRKNAITHIDRALDELQQAQRADTKGEKKDEKKVQELQQKQEHLQKRIDKLED